MTVVLICAAVFCYPLTPKNPISFQEGFYLTNLPIITVWQGHKQLNLLLDTGSSHNSLNHDDIVDLEYTETDKFRSNIGKEGNETRLSIINVNFGYKNTRLNADFMIDDLSAAFKYIKNATGVTLHGIVGSEFFARYGYILDFKNLTFYKK